MNKCITVTSTCKKWPYYYPTMYHKGIRKKDGEPVWKKGESVGCGRRSRGKAIKEAKEIAKEMGVHYIDNVRHNDSWIATVNKALGIPNVEFK